MYDDNNSSSSGSSSGGEYHYIRPESSRSSWSDAGYEPVSGASRVPPSYHVSEPSSRKKRRSRSERGISPWLLLCACMLCAVIGGVAGAAALNYVNGKSEAVEAAAPEETQTLQMANTVPTPQPVQTPAPKPSADMNSAPVFQASPATGDTLSGTQIYSLACRQAVAITSEINYTNIFGYTSSGAVSGSGFVISDDGYILTNYHVISSAKQYGAAITVLSYDGTEYTAAIAGYDEDNDVALLKISGSDLEPVSIGDSDSIQVGQTVYAVGNPMGELAFSQTCGTISALDRVINTSTSYSGINMFQIDAAVNSGNSGGPLYDADGQVIGMVTAKYSEEGVEGLGFAIPINDAIDIANELIAKGYISGKADMGVTASTLSTTAMMFYNLPQGAYIESVDSGSSAEAAGLQAGDIITAVGDTAISSASDLTAVTKSHAAGDSVVLHVYRSGKVLSLDFTYDEYVPDTATVVTGSGETVQS